ncbi:MAG: NAD(P)-dependent glycerol-3-phosphate dehydrogenase [Chitinophagales bacterium]|nr:NAD(P)-dependent glycerol-3-phosphate dehydrogenase [Chitinophagales bacterium]
MILNNTSEKIGVIGAGSFGSTIANILAEKSEVLIFARDREEFAAIEKAGTSKRGHRFHENVKPVASLEEMAESCRIIFPIVPSANFRSMIQDLSPFLKPYHLLIHGTKGIDIPFPDDIDHEVDRSKVKTMSEVIREETNVVRIGCLAGPNLATEIKDKQPAATVVASKFDEVIVSCKSLLRTPNFQIYGNEDLLGVEWAGILKNAIAIAAGILVGVGYGDNAKALLLTRGMGEMIYLGNALGADAKAFLGLAGIGDLIATCNSKHSRNFTVGYRIAQGEQLEKIIDDMDEVAEGVKTVKVAKLLSDHYEVPAPITQTLYRILFSGLSVEKGIKFLMRYPAEIDADYVDFYRSTTFSR